MPAAGSECPFFALPGTACTALDCSARRLESERSTDAREGYPIEPVQADMTKPLPFADGGFGLMFHPVSNVSVRAVRPIRRECFRALRPGGVLLAGPDNGIRCLFDASETTPVNALPFDPLAAPAQMAQLEQETCGIPFSPTMEEQPGGQLEAGFVLPHLCEDANGSGRLHGHNVPCFWPPAPSSRAGNGPIKRADKNFPALSLDKFSFLT